MRRRIEIGPKKPKIVYGARRGVAVLWANKKPMSTEGAVRMYSFHYSFRRNSDIDLLDEGREYLVRAYQDGGMIGTPREDQFGEQTYGYHFRAFLQTTAIVK